jgi:hypothetical protein
MTFEEKYPELITLLNQMPDEIGREERYALCLGFVAIAREYVAGPTVGWAAERDSVYRMVMLALLSVVDQERWGRFDETRLRNVIHRSRGILAFTREKTALRLSRARGFFQGLDIRCNNPHNGTEETRQLFRQIARAMVDAIASELEIDDLKAFVAPVRIPEQPDYPQTWQGLRSRFSPAQLTLDEGDFVQGFRAIHNFDEQPWLLVLTNKGNLYRLSLDGTGTLLNQVASPPEKSTVFLSSNGKYAIYVMKDNAYEEDPFVGLIVWDLMADNEFARIDAFGISGPPRAPMMVNDVDCGDLYGNGFVFVAVCDRGGYITQTYGRSFVFSRDETGELARITEEDPVVEVLGPMYRDDIVELIPIRDLRTGEVAISMLFQTQTLGDIRTNQPTPWHLHPQVFDRTEDGRMLLCSWRSDRSERRVSVSGAENWEVSYRRSYFAPGIIAAALHPHSQLALVVSQGDDLDLVGPDGATPLVAHVRRDSLPPSPTMSVYYVGFTPDGADIQIVMSWGGSFEVLQIPIAELT